jgi:hypothetical protein
MIDSSEDGEYNPAQVDPIHLDSLAALNHPQDSLKKFHDSNTDDDRTQDAEVRIEIHVLFHVIVG